jgi:hypothetical protein
MSVVPERIVRSVVPELASRLACEGHGSKLDDDALYRATLELLFRRLVARLARARGLLRDGPPDEVLDDLPLDDGPSGYRILGAWLEVLLGYRLAPAGERMWELVPDRSARKASGSYYTPEPIVRRILERTVLPALDERTGLEGIPRFRVLDPAMGTGQFLVAAFEAITARLTETFPHMSRARLGRYVARRCLFGVDLNPLAAELARASLWLAVGDAQLALRELHRNLRQGNALVGTLHPGNFDAVIGNPPFLDKKQIVRTLPDLDREWRRNGCFRTARGIYDTYMLFVERAVQVVRPAGRVGMLTPIPWLTQSAGAPLREVLRESGSLRLLDESAGAHFDGALVKVVGTVLQRGAKSDVIEVEGPGNTRVLPTSLVDGLFHGQIRTDVDPADFPILEKIRRTAQPLSTYYTPTFGLRACSRIRGAFRKDHWIQDRGRCRNPVRYIEADDLAGDAIAWRGRWLDYQPESMYSPRTPSLFEWPKVLVPSLLGRRIIRAVLDREGYYADQSLVCISAAYALPDLEEDTVRPSLEAIALQLNSAMVSFVFAHAIVGEALGGGAIHATPGIVGRLPIVAEVDGGPVEECLGVACGLTDLERARILEWYATTCRPHKARAPAAQ